MTNDLDNEIVCVCEMQVSLLFEMFEMADPGIFMRIQMCLFIFGSFLGIENTSLFLLCIDYNKWFKMKISNGSFKESFLFYG